MHASIRFPAPDTSMLIAPLRSPLCYPHPVERIEMLETHISWVFLAGAYAYKVKKPVKLDFLDFSSLELRHRYCDEELRLNRRTAPALYVDVVPITGTPTAPLVGGEGTAIEYAVRMRRFAQSDRLDEVARRGQLSAAHIDALAACVADFHAHAARCGAAVPPGRELALALDNLRALERLDAGGFPRATLAALRDWTECEHRAIAGALAQRRAAGFVRECHGDLHLGNIVMQGCVPVPFDCIEFNEELRCIDVLSDVAFVSMDLRRHGLPGLAARFVDAYLARTGDYEGLAVLRFFGVYRALVRAKIAAIRASQAGMAPQARERELEEVVAHVRLATLLAARPQPALTIMHGLSGSGKTRVSQRLLEAQDAVRLRSDVERKRLHGLDAAARGAAPPGEGRYTPLQRGRVYVRLEALAGAVLAAGYPVIVDAAFLARANRDRFRALARAAGAAFLIVCCAAPEAVLRDRVAAREAAGADASDAGVAVLESQLAAQEPLAGEELEFRNLIDASQEV